MFKLSSNFTKFCSCSVQARSRSVLAQHKPIRSKNSWKSQSNPSNPYLISPIKLHRSKTLSQPVQVPSSTIIQSRCFKALKLTLHFIAGPPSSHNSVADSKEKGHKFPMKYLFDVEHSFDILSIHSLFASPKKNFEPCERRLEHKRIANEAPNKIS
jgi:hypothetical protein